MSSFRRGGWVVACLAITIVAHLASATVTQVDGEILPRPNGSTDCDGAGGDNLQICFNTLEGVSPPNSNAIDQTLDAAQLPEIFLPNTAVAVTFRDISEGAGYENSFGWYNIGDDVVTATGMAANLHPVLGCGRPMAAVGDPSTHTGNPAFYVQNAEPGSVATVDFAMVRPRTTTVATSSSAATASPCLAASTTRRRISTATATSSTTSSIARSSSRTGSTSGSRTCSAAATTTSRTC
jgi:hypothetical protein